MNNEASREQQQKQVNVPEDVQAEIIDDIPEAADETQQEEVQAEVQPAEGGDAQKIEELEAQVAKEKKEYLFLMAEFDNFRKRTVKEKGEIIRNAAEKVLQGLLPIVDDFERALAAEQNEQARQGMELIYQKLVKYLTSNGVKVIESTGADFDPELHEAIAMVPGDEEKKGKVIDTPEKGYMLNDKVLRHAKVAVGA